jgi:hypothetical protein
MLEFTSEEWPMNIEIRLLETIAQHDGQLDYYGISVGKGFSDPASFNQLFDALKRIRSEGSVNALKDERGHVTYWITEKGRARLKEALIQTAPDRA